MNRAFIYLALLPLLIHVSCQEPEQRTIIHSELAGVSDTLIEASSLIVDLPEISVSSFGHCWGLSENPTLSDSVAEMEGAPEKGQTFSMQIRSFEANKTYFVRAFVRGPDQQMLYGNTISINTTTVAGKWTRIKDFFNPTFDAFAVASTGAFYRDQPFFDGGALEYTSDGQAYYNKYVKKFDPESNEWQIVTQGNDIFGHIGLMSGEFYYSGLGGEKNYFYSTAGNTSYAPLGCSDRFRFLDLSNLQWYPLAPLPGPPRIYATAFTLENKIYVFGGWRWALDSYDQEMLNDFWIYDIGTDSWTEGPSFPGLPRIQPVSFNINGKAYVGSGFTGYVTDERNEDPAAFGYVTNPANDFWEFDPLTNSWRQIKSFPGRARGAAIAFGIGDFGYFGTGLIQTGACWNYDDYYGCSHVNQALKDFWRYDPAVETWTQLLDFPGLPRFGAAGFSSNSVGCIGLGRIDSDVNFQVNSDVWIYDPSTN